MIELRLPNAIRNGEGTWTKKVLIDEMEGDEEDILADQTRDTGGTGVFRVSGPERVTQILSRCTVSIGDMTRPQGEDRYSMPDFFKKVWDLGFSTDRQFAMVRLRQLSLGDLYKFDRNCPACKKEIKNITIDLSQLDVTDKPIEYVSKLYHEIELPKSKDRISWKFVQGVDETTIEQVMREHKADFLSVMLWRRLHKVAQLDPKLEQYTSPAAPPGGLLYTKRMKSFDRRFMAAAMDAGEGGLDTDFQIVCDNCQSEFTSKLQVMGSDFFFPSATPSPASSTSARLPNAGSGPQKSLPESPSENEPA